ncbi:MAG TPA: glycosyltransferase [Candidatus Eisenbacteria bacterium]|nr:glycosyltransferase [Candidatus Eisenbacteria bacterium]
MSGHYAYLGGDALHTGMYLALIQRLEREGLTVDFVPRIKVSPLDLAGWNLGSAPDHIGPNPIATVREQIQGQVLPVPVWWPAPWLSAGVLERGLGGCSADRRIVLHARLIVMGRLGLALRRRCPSVRVIFELEGDTIAEADYKFSQLARPSLRERVRFWLEKRFWLRYERRVLGESDAIACVSHKLKGVIIRRYGIPAERVHVFPSVASRDRFFFDPERRARRRQALGLDDRFIVTYNGNLVGRWQVPEKLVEAFRIIQADRPDAVFLVLTPEDHFRNILPHLEASGLPKESYRLRSCPHPEVVDHLCAADVGLLLRDRHPMNEAAAPGKFAEYVLCGLPIVMTDGIGDFSEHAKASPYACVLPGLDDLSALRPVLREFCARTFTNEQREAFSRWGAERFAIELYVPELAALYRSLAGEAT